MSHPPSDWSLHITVPGGTRESAASRPLGPMAGLAAADGASRPASSRLEDPATSTASRSRLVTREFPYLVSRWIAVAARGATITAAKPVVRDQETASRRAIT